MLIRTKHGAHSFRIRSSNGNDMLSHHYQYAVYIIRYQFAERAFKERCSFVIDTLLIRYLYVRRSLRCANNLVGRMPSYRNRTVTVLRTNIPFGLRSVNERSAYWSFVGIRRIIVCMHKNLRRTVRITTYANVLRRAENELKPMS